MTGDRVGESRSHSGVIVSFEQERLVFLQQFEPSSSHYNVSAAFRLTGTLDAEALEWAFLEVVARHEALRMRFMMVDGTPVQELGAVDFERGAAQVKATLTIDERQEYVQQAIHDVISRPFDLSEGPLLRVHLLELEPVEHILLIVMHHVICDSWSLGILAREVSILYGNRLAGQASALPPLPLQYRDYCRWQRATITGSDLERQLAYWRSRLTNAPTLDFRTQRERPPLQGHAGGHHRFRIPEKVATKLLRLGRERGSTLFMTVLATFSALLSRYTGQQDLVIGTPISGRNRVEFEHVIGLFLNSVPLRMDLSGDPTFNTVLERARDEALGAYENRDAPFAELISELEPVRDLSRTPLFQVLLVVDQDAEVPWALGGLSSVPEPIESGTAKFDLTLFARRHGASLSAEFEYNIDVFDHVLIEGLSSHLMTLLERVAANPAARLSEIAFLSDAERAKLMTWTSTDAPCSESCVHELFEQQVRQTPHAIAASWGQQDITYDQLNRRANKLARHVIGMKRLPKRVGVLLPRSLDLIAALLAILKAGAAYVPLDPEHPDVRLHAILDDAQLDLLVTDRDMQERVREARIPRTGFEIEPNAIVEQPDTNPRCDTTPEDLLYIIYTSGSTGTPKGIALPHRVLTNLLDWHWRVLGSGAATLQYASVGFDASAHEMFSALCSGGRVVLIGEESRRDISAMIDVMDRYRVNRAILPGVVLDQLAEECCIRHVRLPHLRHLIATGEQLHVTPSMRKFFTREACLLHNHYGPSETHVVTALTLGGPPDSWPTMPPIGRPISNTQVYVVDSCGQLSPIGIVGELLIGGRCVSHGYWQRPELTTENFVPDRFRKVAGRPLYRTGDMVRWSYDGQLEFLGRRDDQVKIRGCRVEPGEIEKVLACHPDVDAAVVTTNVGIGRDPMLMAHVVSRKDASVEIDSLRQFLRARLPDYMVPSRILRLTALPITQHGKVDRSKLTASSVLAQEYKTTYVSPRTPTEETLSGMWADILNVPRVGAADNFFDLGGHSLLAMRIVARAAAAFKRHIPLKALFRSPTLSGFASEVDSATADTIAHSDAVIPIIQNRTNLPVTFNQEKRLLTEDCLRLRQTSIPPFNLSLCLEFTGTLQLDALERALQAVASRHEVVRACFSSPADRSSSDRGVRLAKFMRTGVFSLGQYRHSIASERPISVKYESVERCDPFQQATLLRQIARREATLPFRYDETPLIRFSIVKAQEGRHLLLIVLPHLICDAIGLQTLKRDLLVFYHSNVAARAEALPRLSHQFADFAAWQHDFLNGSSADPLLSYWSTQWGMFGDSRLKSTDFLTCTAVSSTSSLFDESVKLDSATTETLRELGRDLNVTPYMACLAALYLSLYRHTEKYRLAIWANFANREQVEFTDVLGWFVNSHLIGIDLHGCVTGRDVILGVQSLILDAYAHQALPVGRLWHAFGSVPVVPGELPIFCDFQRRQDSVICRPRTGGEPLCVDEVDMVWGGGSDARGLRVTVVESQDHIDLHAAYNRSAPLGCLLSNLLADWSTIIAALPRMVTMPITALLGRTVDISRLAGGAS